MNEVIDAFSEEYNNEEDLKGSTNSFLYRDIKNVVRQEAGDPPLPWGEYPDGMDTESEEAINYDLFRSKYLGLPSEKIENDLGEEELYSIHDQKIIKKAQAMPEGSQNTDKNWVVASKIVHSYLNPNAKPFGSTETREVYKGVQMDGFPAQNTELEDAKAYGNWGVNFMTAIDYNWGALVWNAGKLNNAPPKVAKAMYYLMETADRDGMLLSNFGKGMLATALDPSTLVGLGTLGLGLAGKFAGKKLSRMAFKEVLKKTILTMPSASTAYLAGEGAVMMGVDNYARQNIKVDAGVQDDINVGEVGTSTALGGAFGSAIDVLSPSVIEGGKRLIVGAGKKADEFLNNNKVGTTLNMGVDPTVPIAEGLSKLGKALDDTTPKVDQDYLGFYSKALEVTKTLKQEKGSGQQFKGMLIKNGVKQDELDWLGLDEVLSKDKVTKAEIEQHINDNRITISEEVAEVNEIAEAMNFDASEENVRLDDLAIKSGAIPDKMKATYTPEDAYGNDYLANRASEILEDHNANLSELDLPMTEARAMELATDEYYDNPIRFYEDKNTGYVINGNDEVGYSIFTNKIASYDNRNRLKTMNNDEDIYSLNEAVLQAQSLAQDDGILNAYGSGARHRDYTVDEGNTGDNYREIKLILYDSKEGDFYEQSHYDEENILASIRTTDRVSDDGSKVLFVEEIQSDWGQQGRSNGFKPTNKQYKDTQIEIKKLIAEHEKEINSYTIKQGDKRIPFADWYYARIKELAVSDYDKTMADGKNFTGLQQHFDNELRLGNIVGVIDKSKYSDYKTSMSNIQEMYGNINSKNASLTKRIPQAPFVTDTNKWTGLTIKRLMAKAEEEGYDSIAFSAGIIHANRWNNQGLKTYYDKVLPSVINKVVGKIDKSSIGKVTLVHSNYNENTGLKIYSDLDGFPQLAIRLTPKVKETVKKGQALFSAGGLLGAGMLGSQGENSEVMNGNT